MKLLLLTRAVLLWPYFIETKSFACETQKLSGGYGNIGRKRGTRTIMDRGSEEDAVKRAVFVVAMVRASSRIARTRATRCSVGPRRRKRPDKLGTAGAR